LSGCSCCRLFVSGAADDGAVLSAREHTSHQSSGDGIGHTTHAFAEVLFLRSLNDEGGMPLRRIRVYTPPALAAAGLME
jgi:hypothetical protein